MTTSNANQFIGSKISLISKSEIRYEGILYSLDLQDATISLAKVKSFGTEDRPTERPVPCKEEIYEFIIFRGSDIKGIDVLEPPKATATLTGGLPSDPAIVEVSHSHYHSAGQSGQVPIPAAAPQTNAGYPSGPSVSSGYSGFGGAALLGTTKSAQQGNSELHSGVEQPSGISVPLDSTGSTHDTSRSNASTPSYLSNRKSPTNDAGIQVTNEDRSRHNRQLSSSRQGDGRGSRPTSQDRRRQHRTQQGADRQTGYQPRGRGNFVNNRGGFRGRGGRRGFGNQGFMQAQQPAKVTFEDPFDFEKANEELQEAFAKLKLRPEDLEKKEGEQDGGEGSNPENEEQENKQPAEPYYVKESFFDKISCEATEKGKGRPSRVDWKAERQLNAETFGLPLNNGQRRGGYQRGGFRGGFRGYGGPPRGNYNRGGYGGYNAGYGYGNSGGYYQYNNRYNGGRGGNRGYRQQQQQNLQQQQLQKQPQKQPQQTAAQ